MLHIIHPATIINDTEHVLQELMGEIDKSTGLWQLKQERFCVCLPYNDKGTVVKRYIPRELAFLLDWGKIQDTLLRAWKNNELDSSKVENAPIEQLLCQYGILVAEDSSRVVINGAPQYTYVPAIDYVIKRDKPLEVIDITKTINSKSVSD